MLMAAIAFNLKKYLKKGGKKPSMGIFEAIMDVFQGYLTTFYRHIRPRPVLLIGSISFVKSTSATTTNVLRNEVQLTHP